MWIMVDGIDEMGDPMYSIIEYHEGSGTHFLTLGNKEKACRIMSALKWQDALGEGTMSLAQDGITFDANTGKIWTPPKKSRKETIQITKARKK